MHNSVCAFKPFFVIKDQKSYKLWALQNLDSPLPKKQSSLAGSWKETQGQCQKSVFKEL